MPAGPATSSPTPVSVTNYTAGTPAMAIGATVSTAGPATIAAAALINQVYARNPNGADRTDTTDTATAITTALGNPVVNTTFEFYVQNVGTANDVILAGG